MIDAELKAAAAAKVQRALDLIQSAQNDLGEACSQLSALQGGIRMWQKTGKLYDQVHSLWYAVASFRAAGNFKLDSINADAVKRRSAGFSLIELVLAVAIFAILLTVAVPSFRTVLLNNGRSATANSLLAAANLARSEAVKQHRRTVLCGSTDGIHCDGDFRVHVIAMAPEYTETLQDETGRRFDITHDAVLFQVLTMPAFWHLSVARTEIEWRPSGESPARTNWTLCDERGTSEARALVVTYVGGSRIAKTDQDGHALVCA